MEDVSPLSDENMDESKTDNFGDTTSGSLLTHDPGEAFLSTRFRKAETDAASVRLNLFERGTYAFPKPIGADESLSSRTDVCLDAFAEDEPNLTIDDSIETIADLIPKPRKDEKPLPEHSLKFQRPPFPEPISVLFGPSTRIEYVASDSSDQDI